MEEGLDTLRIRGITDQSIRHGITDVDVGVVTAAARTLAGKFQRVR